jgi:hypothetical protein
VPQRERLHLASTYAASVIAKAVVRRAGFHGVARDGEPAR